MAQLLILSQDVQFNQSVKRILKEDTLIFEHTASTVNVVLKLIKQVHPDVLLIHHTVNSQNIGVILDYLVTNKVIPVVYINPVSNFGHIYHVMDDLYFMNIEEIKLGSLLEFAVKTARKVKIEITRLTKDLEKMTASFEEEKYVVKAKFKLMQELHYTEEEAYQTILKQAMNRRVSKGTIAKEILKTI